MAKKNGSAAAAAEQLPRTNARSIELRVGDMLPRPGLNARRRFDKAEIKELATTIRNSGLHQPIVLHETHEKVKHVVAGERRWRACMLLGPDTVVPATIKEYSAEELVELMIIENFQRVDLTAVEEARAFEQALQLPGMTQAKLAQRLGGDGKNGKRASQPYISNRIRLLKLPDAILDLVDAGKLQPTIARDVLLPYTALPEPYRTAFFDRIATDLSEPPEDDPLHDPQDEIVAIALDMTRSLNPNGYGADTPLFQPKRHEKGCDCGAPELIQRWNQKERRCWNIEWWNAEQKRAKADKKKREQRAAEKAPTSKEQLGGLPVMDNNALYRKYGGGYGADAKYVTIASNSGDFAHVHDAEPVFDPSSIDPASLIVVNTWGQRYELASIDVKGVNAARAQFAAAVKDRVKAEREKWVARDLEAVRSPAAVQWRDTAVVVRTLLAIARPDRLNALARELGFKPTGGWGEPILNGLSAEEMLDVVNVAVLRCMQHDTRNVLLFEEIVNSEMAAPHREALRALVPWDLNEPDAADEDEDVNDDFEDDALDEAVCVECGCSDSAACEGGCSWLVVDRERCAGVCSSCADSKESAEELLAGAVVA